MSNAITQELSQIHSELVVYPSKRGRKIVAYIDHPPEPTQVRHVVVMSPKYGETKKNNLQLAYFLAQNGLTVLRFDFTCHFGESEGEMLDFTLPAGVEDTLSSIDFVQRTFEVNKVTLLASSLSALMAFRVAELDSRVDHLLCLVGVVDFTYTMEQVYQEDLFGGYIKGRRFGVLDVLGHEVRMDEFLGTAITERMHSLAGTLERMQNIRCVVSLIPAENDTWVKIEDVHAIAAKSPRAKVYPIAGAMHEINENQAAAEKSIKLIIEICRNHCFGASSGAIFQIKIPDKKLVFKQNKIERDRLREARPAIENEESFWGKYLGKYRVMEKMGDYQRYLDLVGSLLGGFSEGEIVLDAGCGNGLFGVWVLHELLERRKLAYEVPPLYFGLDLTDSGLSDALNKHSDVKANFIATNKRHDVSFVVGMMYSRMDLDYFGAKQVEMEELIQFADNCFDKIVCSLLLSYLKSPEELLKQLYRVLRPGGKIVISSMKPFCDLSAIYRDFAEQETSGGELESARELLRAAGAIKVKQEQGYYAFFSGEELAKMLSKAGFGKTEVFISLGNQAYVAVATK